VGRSAYAHRTAIRTMMTEYQQADDDYSQHSADALDRRLARSVFGLQIDVSLVDFIL